jgi:hypothetical protein
MLIRTKMEDLQGTPEFRIFFFRNSRRLCEILASRDAIPLVDPLIVTGKSLTDHELRRMFFPPLSTEAF